MTVESNYVIAIATRSDWLKRLAPVFQPMRGKTKTNRAMRDFSRASGELQVIDHFTVVCLVAWPLNESEAGVDLVLMETSLLLLCKFLLISMRTTSLA